MKILRHRKLDDGSYQLAVHIDEQATLDEEHPLVAAGELDVGDPHPDSVREFTWGPIPPKLDKDGQPTDKPAMSAKDYEAMMLRESKLLIEHEQAQAEPSEGEALSSEGRKL